MAGVCVAPEVDAARTRAGGGRCPPNPPEYLSTEKAEAGGRRSGWRWAWGEGG